ncbi:hypothetical protein HMN09_00310900 [Mycena chlorophos]|uniref:Uncharacterized protein n=1 Tax=Mycena chlorophos TaxID=658473 RepID=A0A8H6TFQ8_MYCCL|nr:hypothetical protein HMN09_00310900 [Mycena chlorophos]
MPSSQSKKGRSKPAKGPQPGEKRNSGGTDPEGARPPKKSRGEDQQNASDSAQADPKPVPDTRHGIHPKAVPKAAKETQRIFQFYVRGLAGLYQQSDVLGYADTAIAEFERRFTPTDNIRERIKQLVSSSLSPDRLARTAATDLLAKLKGRSNAIATSLQRISPAHWGSVFAAIGRSGLSRFHPDVFGPVDSVYNQVHRHLAITTFDSITSGLTVPGVNTSFSSNLTLLADMYDNFVYVTLAESAHLEAHNPGSVAQHIKDGYAYKNRGELSDRRTATAKELGYPVRVRNVLKQAAAHSDDERDPLTGDRRVHEKPGRAAHWTELMRKLDTEEIEIRRRARVRGHAPEVRLTAHPLPPSALSYNIPAEAPADFFDVDFFNKLTVRERAACAKFPAALPPAEVFRDKKSKWKKLDDEEFEEKYGAAALEGYEFPDDAELQSSEDEDQEEELDEDEMQEVETGLRG